MGDAVFAEDEAAGGQPNALDSCTWIAFRHFENMPQRDGDGDNGRGDGGNGERGLTPSAGRAMVAGVGGVWDACCGRYVGRGERAMGLKMGVDGCRWRGEGEGGYLRLR